MNTQITAGIDYKLTSTILFGIREYVYSPRPQALANVPGPERGTEGGRTCVTYFAEEGVFF